MIEEKLREMLVPVLGCNSVDEIGLEDSLVNDLDADSLDFVEIVFLIERKFGVKIETGELISGGVRYRNEEIFVDGKLTKLGAEAVTGSLPEPAGRFHEGMSKIGIFSQITVRDIASMIKARVNEDA